MADLSYKATVDVTQAERSLTSLQNSVAGVNDKFIRLRETLVTLSLGATITNAMNLADTIQDLSDATGIASASILGFSKAVSASGGNSESAQKGILRLVNTIGDAADGSKEAQRAFSEVGITLKDLGTLSEEDLLVKTISGLSKIDDVAKRSTLTTKLLGKEFRGISLQGVAGDYNAAVAASQKYSAAIKSAAETQDKLDATIKNFQLALLNSIKPLTEFINKLDPEAIQIFIDRIIKIGGALTGLFVIGKVVSLVEGYVVASRAASAATLSMAAASGNMFASFALGAKQMAQAFNISSAATVAAYTGYSILGITLKSLATGFLRMIPLIGYAVVAYQLLDGVIETLTGRDLGGWFDDAAGGLERLVAHNFPALAAGINKLGEALGMGVAPSVKAENDAELKRIKSRADAAQAAADALKKQREQQRQIQTDLAKTGLDLRQQTDDYEEQLRFQKQKLANETGLVMEGGQLTNISADQLEIEKAKLDIMYGQRSIIQGMQKQVEKINLDMALGVGDAPEVAAGKIQLLKDAMNRVQQSSYRAQEEIGKYITQQQKAAVLEKSRAAILDELRKQQEKNTELLFGGSKMGKSPLEQQVMDIRESFRKMAEESSKSIDEMFKGKNMEDPEIFKAYTDALYQIKNGWQEITNRQIESMGVSKEFATTNIDAMTAINDQIRNGLITGWEEYKSKAQDTAGQIRGSFETFTSGMEDSFVKFVQTGKLSFKDLANSILADLARIAFKKAVIGMGSMFGFANGGSVMGGTPIVVGERGPELFVPQSAGKIINNATLNGSGSNNSGSNTPTVVNYNIQAVDASSFRSLVARDPSFIYAVTEQGRRGQPTRKLA